MIDRSYFSPNPERSVDERARELINRVGSKQIREALRSMLLIRNFEIRGESAYQHGQVGGFYHAYSGEEAIQTSAVQVFGKNNWYIGFYRCHALALLLGATPKELMAELYGRSTGNAKGRGGSMHLYTDRMLGGFAIVGGHLPIAIGAAFSVKYLKQKDEVALCFLGEGAVAQGAFHESLNLASLWSLPVIFIIENNQWGMGTHASRALCFSEAIAEKQASSYNMKGYTLNGMDYFNCYEGFEHIHREVLETGRPVLVECVCERFKGHSISDPGLYRTKEQLQTLMKKDPIPFLKHYMEENQILTDEEFKAMDKEAKETVIEAMAYAEKSPWPSPATLEEDVYA
ncbi:MAG: pyruvate dehydrogenase (acetyl-transferring) E1 component subunit alpha [Chlamydiales bacterium]|nr:pyruvate dehydrogenase (acetyl-transferring) E1 component subunit alpha [Chlamydiales bacterium]